MKWLTHSVSVFWLYPVAVFAGLCLLPWWESKSGHVHPLATAYVNEFKGWQFLFVCHLGATIILSLIIIGLHLWLARLVKTKQ